MQSFCSTERIVHRAPKLFSQKFHSTWNVTKNVDYPYHSVAKLILTRLCNLVRMLLPVIIM